jgi:hypothetical protein
MAIIGTLPNTISNGQAVDATPVMADFNYIVNQVNANATPLGTLTAPTGTAMLFQQNFAPLGWTAQTSTNDAAIRVMVPGAFVGVAGANAFSGLMRGSATTDSHALTSAELAVHNHGVTDPTHSHSSPPHQHGSASGFNFYTATPTGGATTNFSGGANNINLENLTNPIGVTVSAGPTNISIQNAGSGAGHTHALSNFNYSTMDVILAIKS